MFRLFALTTAALLLAGIASLKTDEGQVALKVGDVDTAVALKVGGIDGLKIDDQVALKIGDKTFVA